MGIKFRCPNGHKLNVKSFLAGKKGVCPKCGTSMRIPSASTEGGDSDIEEQAAAVVGEPMPASRTNGSAHGASAAVPVAPVGIPVGTPAMPAHPVAAQPAGSITAQPAGSITAQPAGRIAAPLPAVPRPGVAAPAAPLAMPAAPGPLPAGPMPLPPAMAAADPIAEAPAASWYVRPPSGVQYGPARGDVMRKWIAEGRVSSDSLVWREGWADWKNAGQLFPNLTSAGGPAAASGAASLPSTVATRSANRYQAKRKSGSGMAVAFLVVLALVCVILVAVLVYVLTTTS